MSDPSGINCWNPVCEDPLLIEEEVFLITIIKIVVKDYEFIRENIIHEEDGDYKWEPIFLCMHCWETWLDELKQLKRDVPPVLDELSIEHCQTCGSGVREDEVVGFVALGELKYAAQQPNNTPEIKWKINKNGNYICTACLHLLAKDVVGDMWDRYPRQNDECVAGMNKRCWRHGCSADGDCLEHD